MKKIILTILCVFLVASPGWSASIAVKVNEGQADDGDVLVAINNRRIQSIHAQHICHKDKVGFNADGYREPGTLLETMLSKTRQYKFVQQSNCTDVKRIDLATLDEETLNKTPNASGEYIDVPLYLQRRLRHSKHLIFGSNDGVCNEYWYGGNETFSQAAVNDIWTEIEARTPNRKADFNKWPFSDTELKHYLILPVEDMTDAEANALVEETPNGGKKKFFPYWLHNELAPLGMEVIRNKNVKKDVRSLTPFALTDIQTR